MTTRQFTTYSQDPHTYVCPDCEGHGGDADPWMHAHDPRQTWVECATCLGMGEVDYRTLDDDTLDALAFGKAPVDAFARELAQRVVWAIDAAERVAVPA